VGLDAKASDHSVCLLLIAQSVVCDPAHELLLYTCVLMNASISLHSSQSLGEYGPAAISSLHTL